MGGSNTCAFSAGQAAEAVGVSYRTIDHWAKTGVVEPGIEKASGTGTARWYSFRDLVALGVAKELRESGVNVQRFAHGIRTLQTQPSSNLEPCDHVLVIMPDGNMIATTRRETPAVLNARKNDIMCMLLDLAKMIEKLNQSVLQVEKPKRGPASRISWTTTTGRKM
jgi:DNA-binding transcriptional MerR regulator